MKSSELKEIIKGGALMRYENLYPSVKEQEGRFIAAIEAFEELYGKERDVYVFSVPGRSEILGNHTDHNRGCVLAGAINRDIIAIASPNSEGVVRLKSEGYSLDTVNISDAKDPSNFRKFTSRALIAGVAGGFERRGYEIGGYDAYTTTQVLKGSGISSSAAFEVMIGNIFNHLYNAGKIDNKEIAKISQYSENVYFGKPCGLMDQMACAVGGFVFIDFEKPDTPIVEPIAFSLKERGLSLCIVNTGGNHANLNADYASVPSEMHAVAKELGCKVLRQTSEAELVEKIPALRAKLGDRAVLRALHFLRENERVKEIKEALLLGDEDKFFELIAASGHSSFEYLQNVYTTINVKEQGLSLALALTDGFLKGKKCAFRVHGGGFAGTIQVFLPTEELSKYTEMMDSVLGKGSAMPLSIRPVGACKLF